MENDAKEREDARDVLIRILATAPANRGLQGTTTQLFEKYTEEVKVEGKVEGKLEAKKEIGGFFKKAVILSVLVTFIVGNLASWWMIYKFANAEFEIVKAKISLPGRIITEKVILATIAGTIIQISAAFAFIVRYLFPPEKKKKNKKVQKPQ